jgi:hypothetical protein
MFMCGGLRKVCERRRSIYRVLTLNYNSLFIEILSNTSCLPGSSPVHEKIITHRRKIKQLYLHKPSTTVRAGSDHIHLLKISLFLQAKAMGVLRLIFEAADRLGFAFKDSFLLEEGICATVGDIAALILLLPHEEGTEAVGIDISKSDAEIGLGHTGLGDEILDFRNDIGAGIVHDGGVGSLGGIDLGHEGDSIGLVLLLGLLANLGHRVAGVLLTIGDSLSLLALGSLLLLLLFVLDLGKETGGGPIRLILRGSPLVLVRRRLGIRRSNKAENK